MRCMKLKAILGIYNSKPNYDAKLCYIIHISRTATLITCTYKYRRDLPGIESPNTDGSRLKKYNKDTIQVQPDKCT